MAQPQEDEAGNQAELVVLEQQQFSGGGWRYVQESVQDLWRQKSFLTYETTVGHHAPSLCRDLRSTFQ